MHHISYSFIRGLAGTCLVYKIAGAMARRNGSLNEVYDISQWVAKRVGTIGVGLEHCHVGIVLAGATLALIYCLIGSWRGTF